MSSYDLERYPDPQPRAAAAIARWLGPGLLLLMLGAWTAVWFMPQRDTRRFRRAQQAGLEQLPPPPPPNRDPGIDNRALDPADKEPEHGPHPGPGRRVHAPPPPDQGFERKPPLDANGEPILMPGAAQ
jgi:hypothetical protein